MTAVVPRSADLTARQLSLPGSAHVEFGLGAVARLPAALVRLGVDRVFVVTDPGIRAAGVLATVLAPLDAAGVPYGVFDEVHPNPSTAYVLAGAAGAAPLLETGSDDVAVLEIDSASAISAPPRTASARPLLPWLAPILAPGSPSAPCASR